MREVKRGTGRDVGRMFEWGKGCLYRAVMTKLGGESASRLLKRFCDSAFSRHLLPAFVRLYRVNLSETNKPLSAYRSLSDFFVRAIDPRLRPIHADPSSVASPVDGYVQTFGDIAADCTFEVKGRSYSFEELTSLKIGASGYAGGKFIVLYLSPAQYHRFHSPLAGEGRRIAELGRTSLPVNAAGWRYGGRLLALNHRVVFGIRRRGAEMLMIAVGALNVNSIEQHNHRPFWGKGEEIGYFSFGSTVVCLFGRGEIEWAEGLKEETYVRVGERLADLRRTDREREPGGTEH